MRDEFRRRVPHYDPEGISPEILSIYRAIESFTCPIRVLVIDAEQTVHFWGGDCTKISWIHFDLERYGTSEYKFLGEIKKSEVRQNKWLIERVCGTPIDEDHLDGIAKFTSVGISEGGKWHARAVPNDVRFDLKVAGDLLFHDVIWEAARHLSPRFDPRPDFQKNYSLQPTPERPVKDLLREHPFFSLSSDAAFPGDYRHLRDRERECSRILLIPNVPESIQGTFGIAKELYIYSTFVHYFATVSKHYTFLAAEAALKMRWCQTIKWPAVLSRGNKTLVVDRTVTTHHELLNMAEQSFKTRKSIKINGEPLPASTTALIDRLLQQGVVNRWYADLLKYAMALRNTYSHREFGVIDMMEADDLRRIAELINTLFHRPDSGGVGFEPPVR